jgi:hypothetical protein
MLELDEMAAVDKLWLTVQIIHSLYGTGWDAASLESRFNLVRITVARPGCDDGIQLMLMGSTPC